MSSIEQDNFLDPLGVNKCSMHKSPKFDFSDPKISHDRVLLVEGKKFYVHSGVLIVWSTYFEILFAKNSQLCKAKEIEIKDVTAEDFEIFLQCIHPSEFRVTDTNCLLLVKLAHRFLAIDVFQQCRAFLDETSDELNPTEVHQSVLDFSLKGLQDAIAKKEDGDADIFEKRNSLWFHQLPSFDFFDPNIAHDRLLRVQERTFYVHSGVLIVWTEYFKEVFAANSNTCKSQEIEVKDVKAADFEAFLKLIYANGVIPGASNLFSVMDLAHRFQAPEVVNICNDCIIIMFDQLDKLDLLEKAVKYGMEDIKDKIADFILSEKVHVEIDCTCPKQYICRHHYDSVVTIHGYAINMNCFLAKNYERFSKLSSDARVFIFNKILEKNYQKG